VGPGDVVVAALRKLGPGATGPEIYNYLAHLGRFAGLDGIFNFPKNPQRGLDVSEGAITRWDDRAETFAVMSKRRRRADRAMIPAFRRRAGRPRRRCRSYRAATRGD
jgi:hypothetical protein